MDPHRSAVGLGKESLAFAIPISVISSMVEGALKARSMGWNSGDKLKGVSDGQPSLSLVRTKLVVFKQPSSVSQTKHDKGVSPIGGGELGSNGPSRQGAESHSAIVSQMKEALECGSGLGC